MYLFAMIFVATIGSVFFGIGLWHEYIWWKRRNWQRGSGIIVGHQTSQDTDGETYPPVIEYQFSGEPRTFVSKYSSSRKPTIGLEVALRISPDGQEAERDSLFNRILFSFGFGGAGLLVILLGATSQPLPEETVREETRGAYHDARTLEQRDEVMESPEKEAEKVQRFLKEQH